MEEKGAKTPPMWLPGLDEIEQRSWQQFVESSMGLLAALNQSLGRHRLDLFELRLLEVLARSDTGSARMSELAESLMLLRSRVTWLTRRLETRGLVRRGRIAGDGRGVRAEITPDGRMRVAEARKTYAQQIRQLYVNQMSRQQMLALGASCQQINSSLAVAELRAKSVDERTSPLCDNATTRVKTCRFPIGRHGSSLLSPGMGHPRANEQAVWGLPTLAPDEGACVQQFMESSLRLFEILNDSLIGAHGLTLFEFLALDLLARSEAGSARMGGLAEAFALAPSRVTQMVDRLTEQGLVTRCQHPGDRRAVLACITGRGRERLEPAIATYARAIRRNYLEPLSRPQVIALGDVCRRTGLPPGPTGAR